MSERTVAVIDGNTVVNVIVIAADHVLADGEVEYTEANPAGIGWEYDGTGFIAPQPFPSWQLVDYVWQAPTPMPEDGEPYFWNEDTLSWETPDA